MQFYTTLPPETFRRLQQVRRSERFEKVPSTSELIRRFVEEGLDRLEKAPEADATARGHVTNTKGIGR